MASVPFGKLFARFIESEVFSFVAEGRANRLGLKVMGFLRAECCANADRRFRCWRLQFVLFEPCGLKRRAAHGLCDGGWRGSGAQCSHTGESGLKVFAVWLEMLWRHLSHAFGQSSIASLRLGASGGGRLN